MNAADRRASLLHAVELAERNTVIGPLWYPAYHAAPPVGWMNDPNGLCRQAGVTHLFYQYAPLRAGPGLNCWGHLSTKDYVHYTRFPPALVCDEAFDCHGVYSGSAAVTEDGIRLFYTGNVRNEAAGDGISAGREQYTVTCFSRDAVHFDDKRVILAPGDYPPDMSCHVRDPKIIPAGNGWDLLLGMRTDGGRGGLLVYWADVLTGNRTLRTRTEDPEDVYMWECPDCFFCGGERFLSVCRQSSRGDTACYCTVTEDYVRTGDFRIWDSGPDFYAPQTFTDEDGRTVLFAWMGKPGNFEKGMNPESRCGWVHMMTLPRILSEKGGTIVQEPHPALENLRLDAVTMKKGKTFSASPCLNVVWDGETARDGTFRLRIGALKITVSEGVLSADPGRWGHGRTAQKLPYPGGGLSVFTDRSSVEIFPREGPTVTMRIYPEDPSAVSAVWEAGSGRVTLYPMDRIRYTKADGSIKKSYRT